MTEDLQKRVFNLSEKVGLDRFKITWAGADNLSDREELLCRCICTKCVGYEHADGETYCVGGNDFVPSELENHIDDAITNSDVVLTDDGLADFNTRFFLNLSDIEILPFKIGKVMKYININSTDLRELDLSHVRFHEGRSVDPSASANGSYGMSLLNNRYLNNMESLHISQVKNLNYISLEPSFFSDYDGIWREYKKLMDKRVSIQTYKDGKRHWTFTPFKNEITGHIFKTIANKNSTFDASDLRRMIKYLKELVKTK